MLTATTQFDAELRKRIEAEIEQLGTDLGNGAAIDYADYRFRVGRIQGLVDALAFCDDAQTTISKQ